MKWKQLSYWLKGGIIGGIILVVIGIILLILTYNCFKINGEICKGIYDKNNDTARYEAGLCYYEHYKKCDIYTSPLYYTSEFPLAILMNGANRNGVNLKNAIITDIFLLVDLILIGFIIGGVIGWVYERVKSK